MTSTLYIDGRWTGSARDRYERSDAADDTLARRQFTRAEPADVGAACAAAARAQPGWADESAATRALVLQRAADRLEADLDTVTETLIADIGKARRDARAEVLRGCAILRYHAASALQPAGDVYPSADPATLLITLEEPVGIVGAITPWNFPVAIPLWKLAPALVHGNAVVWKPAEAASGSAVVLTGLLSEAGLPAGILNLVTGSGRELSAAITGAPELTALTFTGSTAVGRRLSAAVADRTVKLQLEMGGKNPAIVLADADLDDAADQIVRGAMLATGQRCTATSRAYVDATVYDRCVDAILERVHALRVGDPRSDDTDIGPLATDDQAATVGRFLRLARDSGCRVLCGGSPPDGRYVQPTVLADVPPASPLLREEIFGPVLCVAPVDGLADALAHANDTTFGLSSSIFTRDLGAAIEFARRTRSGVVHVNRETANVEPHVPFGGLKDSSSLQREQGTAARAFFTNSKTLYIRTT